MKPNARSKRSSRQRGAAIFIVAVTLALLATMGIYGLTATRNDVVAAGHLRENTQLQHADNGALMAAAESFTPGTAAQLVRDMVDPLRRSNQATGTPCKTSNAPTNNANTQNAEACLRLTEAQMQVLAASINPWNGPLFSATSLGSNPDQPYFRVEITNPIEVPGPAGMSSEGSAGSQVFFAEVTVTVFVDMKTDGDAGTPADSTMLGRGRLTVGPYRR